MVTAEAWDEAPKWSAHWQQAVMLRGKSHCGLGSSPLCSTGTGLTRYCCEALQHSDKALDVVHNTTPARAPVLLSALSFAAHPDVLLSWGLASDSAAQAEGGTS